MHACFICAEQPVRHRRRVVVAARAHAGGVVSQLRAGGRECSRESRWVATSLRQRRDGGREAGGGWREGRRQRADDGERVCRVLYCGCEGHGELRTGCNEDETSRIDTRGVMNPLFLLFFMSRIFLGLRFLVLRKRYLHPDRRGETDLRQGRYSTILKQFSGSRYSNPRHLGSCRSPRSLLSRAHIPQ